MDATTLENPEITDVPWLPAGREVDLGEHGTLFVRDTGAAGGRPAVVLLHGWGATADLNWFPAYPVLAERYRLVAFDHRGHGRGLRPVNGMVRLSHCADDVVAVLDALGIASATIVGYSMGGAVAQLVWRRHPERVAGLVLASTARHFQGGPISDLWYRSHTPLAHVAHRAQGPAEAIVRRRVERRAQMEQRTDWIRSEMEGASPAGLLSALRSLGRFRSNGWIREIDVPTAVVVTTRDRTVMTGRQRRLAAAIAHAERFDVAGPHDSIISRPDEYVPTLLDAIAHATSG